MTASSFEPQPPDGSPGLMMVTLNFDGWARQALTRCIAGNAIAASVHRSSARIAGDDTRSLHTPPHAPSSSVGV